MSVNPHLQTESFGLQKAAKAVKTVVMTFRMSLKFFCKKKRISAQISLS